MKIGNQTLSFEKGERPGRLMKEAARDMAREIDAALRELGASTASLSVIYSLSEAGQLPQSELARACNVEQPTIAQLLKRMERNGVVIRETDPNDKRSYLFRLSPAHEELMPRIEAELERVNERAFQDVSVEEFEVFRKVLKTISRNMNSAIRQNCASK